MLLNKGGKGNAARPLSLALTGGVSGTGGLLPLVGRYSIHSVPFFFFFHRIYKRDYKDNNILGINFIYLHLSLQVRYAASLVYRAVPRPRNVLNASQRQRQHVLYGAIFMAVAESRTPPTRRHGLV